MKRRRQVRVVALFIAILVLAVGCNDEPFQYTFRQDRNQIKTVEICSFDYYNGKTIEPIVTLSEKQTDAILNDISSLECRAESFVVDPILTYGDVIICITYLNGEKEILGIYNIGWVTPSGEWNLTPFYFDIVAVRNLLLDYVDVSILEPISEEF